VYLPGSCFCCLLCSFVASPSVLWYCWLGLLTCKNRLPYNLYCVGGDVKRCTIQSSPSDAIKGPISASIDVLYLTLIISIFSSSEEGIGKVRVFAFCTLINFLGFFCETPLVVWRTSFCEPLLLLLLSCLVCYEQIDNSLSPYVIGSSPEFPGMTADGMTVMLTSDDYGNIHVYDMIVRLCCRLPLSTGLLCTLAFTQAVSWQEIGRKLREELKYAEGYTSLQIAWRYATTASAVCQSSSSRRTESPIFSLWLVRWSNITGISDLLAHSYIFLHKID